MQKILIVEDNDAVLAAIKLCLETKFELVTASNGVEGLKVFNQEHPALVITDLTMPEKDGIELIMVIRASGNSVPIIAISGHLAGANLQAAKFLGANMTLEKPFGCDELLASINNLLATSV